MGEPQFVYHERQQSLLCGQHCLNNLLQGPYFAAVRTHACATSIAQRSHGVLQSDLADFARELHERERALMLESGMDSADALRFLAEDSAHVDDSGNFSVEARARFEPHACAHAC